MGFIRRHRIVVLLLAPVLLGVVWAVYEVYASVTAKPAPDTDYGAEMRALMLEAQQGPGGPAWDPDELNRSWRAFSLELMDAAGSVEGLLLESVALIEVEAVRQGDYDWSVVYDAARWRADAAEREPPFDLTREAVAAEFDAVHALLTAAVDSDAADKVIASVLAWARSGEPLVRPYRGDLMLISVLLPELGQYRRLAQFSAAVMERSAEVGDWDRYAEALEGSLWLAELAASDPILIGYLVGVAIESLMLEQVRRDVVRGRLPGEAIAEVAALLDTYRAPDLALGFRGERVWALDAVQWTHDSRGRLILSSTGQLTMGAGRPRVANLASIVMPRRRETEAAFESFYGDLIEMAELPMHEAREAVNAIDARFEAIPRRQILLQTILPAVGRAAQVQWSSDLNRAGLRTLLAIERHRASEGRLPASLDELVPVHLDSVPVDPFSDGSAALVYRAVADGGERPGYVLYSIGPDGVDDGGAVGEEPLVVIRGEAPGQDWVFTRPE